MPDTPPESDSPNVDVAPTPALAPDSHEGPISTEEDTDAGWAVRIGEVFDFGESGSFTVRERLGRGGMGEVYRVEHVAPHGKFVQIFALKVLRPDALARHERTFIDEVHLLSLLCHNSIARYHSYFVHNGRKVLVMEYVEGRSLHSLLELARRKGRRLSTSTSLELMAQIADALDFAHTAKDETGHPLNIVHRDISPANIMVTNAGFAKLVDFGVAKSDLDDRTQTNTGIEMIKGKFPYVAPEQVELRPLDGRCDLFSLCSVLVEMLTGEPPFGRGGNPADTLRSIMAVTPGHVDSVTRGLPKKVRAVCRKGLAHDPDQRFASGDEMARAMLANHSYQGAKAVREEIAALEALPDATPGTVEKVAAALRHVKRKSRALTAFGALAVASVAAFFLWSAVHSRPTAPAAPPPVVAAPYEQPMSPIAKAEEGQSTVNDEPTPQAPAPAVPKKSGTPKVLPVVAMLMAMGCTHIQTGMKAGDCSHAVKRDFEGKRVPDLFHVALDKSNPNGICTGDWDPEHVTRDEPCPIYEGPIVVKITDLDSEWYGPPDGDPKHAKPEDWKPALLKGQTCIIEATGTYKTDGHPRRNVSERMTALITEIETYDGKTVPVCGVLLGDDGKEGVPIYSPPDSRTRMGGDWGDAKVKFFWPSP